MNINSISTAGVAGAVWTNLTRSLTSIVGGMASVGAVNTSVAAGVILDLRPAAGKFRCIVMNDSTQVSMHNGYYDGTTFDDTSSAAAFIKGDFGATVGLAIKNVSAGALATSWAGIEMS